MNQNVLHYHHIVPKHLGGSDEHSNLVALTVEEHAEAHRKLYEQYGRWQDKLAWLGLAGIIGHEEVIREQNRLKSLGKKLSEEHKAKIRAYRHTPEAKRKIAEANKLKCGKKRTEEAKMRMRLAKLGKTWKSNPDGTRTYSERVA